MAWAAGSGDAGVVIFILLGLAIGLPVYFLPTFIGRRRRVNNKSWLFVVNLLVGWSLIGWIGCVLWAVCGQTQAQDAYWRGQAGS